MSDSKVYVVAGVPGDRSTHCVTSQESLKNPGALADGEEVLCSLRAKSLFEAQEAYEALEGDL